MYIRKSTAVTYLAVTCSNCVAIMLHKSTAVTYVAVTYSNYGAAIRLTNKIN